MEQQSSPFFFFPKLVPLNVSDEINQKNTMIASNHQAL
jgi:hypothetical protein